MSTLNEIPVAVSASVARTIRRAEDFTVETVKNWSETVTRVVPEVKLPIAESLPSAKAAVASGFAVAQQVVEAQRDFVLRVLDSVEERLAAETAADTAPDTAGAAEAETV